MTRSICTLNFKGGTGKTTTVVNLGMGLALRGHRVLAIDLDSQGSVASWLGASYRRSMADLLLGAAPWEACRAEARPRFDIIPADRRLVEAIQWLGQREDAMDVLRGRLDGIEAAGYDYVLLDCAPSVDLLSESALRFAGEVFVPVSMEYLALVGARTVVVEVLRSRRLTGGQSARLSMVIPSFFDAHYPKSGQALQMLQRHFPGIVSKPIRLCQGLSEAPSHQLTIFEYEPGGPGSLDYASLVEKVAGDDRAT